MPAPDSVQEVLAFWFAPRVRPLWFNSTPAFDNELGERFLGTWHSAADGELSHWEQTPEGALALVIVLDQFPLNMFRGEPASFATEAQARAVSERALARGFDRMLSDDEKPFLFLPFMHSESLADQERSVHLYEEAGLNEGLRFAQHHREIVQRFGRFPHRNAILGRDSTPEELAWLESSDAFRG